MSSTKGPKTRETSQQAQKTPGGAQPVKSTTEKPGNQKDDAHSGSLDLLVEGKKIDLYNSLPAKLQELIGEPGQDLEGKTAKFFMKSIRENKFVDVDKKDIEKIAKIAGEEMYEKSSKDIKEKLFKSKDGKTIKMSDFFPKKSGSGSGIVGKRNKTPTSDKSPLNQDRENDQLPDRQHSDLENKLKLRENELNEHQTELKKKEEKLKETEDKLKETENKLKETENKLKEKEEKLKEKEKKLNETEEKVRKLSQTVEEYQVSQKKHEEEMNGVCKNYDKQVDDYKQEISKLKNTVGEKQGVISEQQDALGKMEEQLVAANNKITLLDNEVKALEMQYKETRRALEKANRTVDHIKESHEDAMRHKDNQLKELIADRDDLRHRFSKLAGAKLTDQNPDIADLSDPNRAMKLSEKFGTLYDDQWTDAYEHLQKKKKMSTKDAIALLLDVLKKCEEFCNKLKETQMDSLNNVLLHPKQDVESFGSEPRKHIGGLKEHSRIKSDDKKAVRELRRQIGVGEGVLEEVKQVFVQETKSWPDKKSLEGCTPYVQRCAEICWLMVLHDPPLYMKMDAQRGDPFDSSLYSVYSASGDKIDFLVWPPLFNNQGGGLLSKGTAEPMKVVKKT